MTNLCATHGMNIPDVGCPKCLKAENERLKETLACPRLTIDAPAEQFKAVLADWEKGLVVNSQDLLNALMWRLRNQAKEIARLHKSVDTLNAANRFLSEQLEAERSTHEPTSKPNLALDKDGPYCDEHLNDVRAWCVECMTCTRERTGEPILQKQATDSRDEDLGPWADHIASQARMIENLMTPQAPIAKLIIRESGAAHYAPDLIDVKMYAPGLPPGEHDVYLDPSAPGLGQSRSP